MIEYEYYIRFAPYVGVRVRRFAPGVETGSVVVGPVTNTWYPSPYTRLKAVERGYVQTSAKNLPAWVPIEDGTTR